MRCARILLPIVCGLAAVLFAGSSANAKTRTLAGAENSYLVFDGARDDYYTKDGLVWETNPFDAGAGNDVLKNDGSFEGTWDGTAGGCAAGCPHNMTCNCDDAANATQVTSDFYSGNQCLGMLPGGYEVVDAGWWDFSAAGSYLNYPVDSLGFWTDEMSPYQKTFTAVALIEIPTVGTYTNGQGVFGQEANSVDPNRLDNWALSVGVGAGKSLRARLDDKTDPTKYVDLTTVESNPVIQDGVKTLVAFRFKYNGAGSNVLNISRMDNRGFVEKQITNAANANAERNYWIAGNTDISASFGNLGGKIYWVAMYAGTFGTTGVEPVTDADLQALYNKTKRPNELTDRLIMYTDFHQAVGATYVPEVSYPVPNGANYTATRRPHVYNVVGAPTHGGSFNQTAAASPHAGYWKTCVSACTGGSSYLRAVSPTPGRSNFIPAGDFTVMALMRRQTAGDSSLYTTLFDTSLYGEADPGPPAHASDAAMKVLVGGFFGGANNRVLSSISSDGTNCNGGGACPNWYGGVALPDDETFLLAFVYDYSGTPGNTSSVYHRLVSRHGYSETTQVGNQPGPIHMPDDDHLITGICSGTSTNTNTGYCYWAGAWNRTFSQVEIEGLFRQTTHPTTDYSTNLIEFLDFHQAVGTTYTGDYASTEFGVTGVPIKYGNDGAVVSLPPGNSYVAADGLSFPANSAYQIRYALAGTLGTEKVKLIVEETDSGDQYNFTTKTWGAASYDETTVPASAVWGLDINTVQTGVAKREPVRVYLKASGAGGPVLMDGFTIKPLKLGAPKVAGVTLTTTGNPIYSPRHVDFFRGHSNRPGMWGTQFDSSTIFSCTDADCPWADPTDFSFGFYGTIPFATSQGIARKSSSWTVNANSGTLQFTVYDAGLATSFRQCSSYTSGALNAGIATYDYVGSGTSVLTSNCTGTPSTTSTAVGPINNNANDFEVSYTYTNKFTGVLGKMAFWDRALTDAETNQWLYPHFPDNDWGVINYVKSCSATTVPYYCGEEKCVNTRLGWCPPTARGTWPAFGQFTEYLPYNGFASKTGTDANPTFTGWSKVLTGTGTVVASREHARVGTDGLAYVPRIINKVAGDSISLTSNCISSYTVANSSASLFTKKLSGTAQVTVQLKTYTDGACSTGEQTKTLTVRYGEAVSAGTDWSGIDVPTRWSRTFGTGKTALSGSSAKLVITVGGVTDVVLGNGSVTNSLSASGSMPWVYNVSTTTTYTARSIIVDNPIAKTVNGSPVYESGYCVGGWVWERAQVCGTSYLWYTDDTNKNSTQLLVNNAGACKPGFIIRDKDGFYAKRLLPTTTGWTGENWAYLEGCVQGATVVAHHYDAATQQWYDWTDTTGTDTSFTGVMGGQNTDLYLGSATATTGIPNTHIYRPFVAPFDGTNYSNTLFYKPGTADVALPPRPF